MGPWLCPHMYVFLSDSPCTCSPIYIFFFYTSVSTQGWTHCRWCWSCFVRRRPATFLPLLPSAGWMEWTSNCSTTVRPRLIFWTVSKWSDLAILVRFKLFFFTQSFEWTSCLFNSFCWSVCCSSIVFFSPRVALTLSNWRLCRGFSQI